jgi:hypothetical protein
MNLLNNWKITLSLSMLSLFMSIVSGGWDFLVYFLVLYYIAHCDFDKEIGNADRQTTKTN